MFGRSLKKSLVLSAAALSLCVGTAASADVGLSFSFFDINNCDRYDSGASFQTTTFTSYAPVTTTEVSYGSTYSYFGGYRPYTSFTYGYTPVYQPVVYYNDPVVYYPPPVYVETYYAPVYYRPVYRTSYTYFDTCYPSYGFSSYQGSYSSYSSFSFGLSFTFGNYYGGHRGGRYGRSYYDCYDPCRPIYCPPAYTCQPEQYFRPRGGQLYDSNGGGRVDSGDGFADGQFAPSNARDRREVGRGNGGTEGVMGASQFDQSRSNAKPGFAANARGGSKTPVSIMGTGSDVKPGNTGFASKPASFAPGAFKPVGADHGKRPEPLPMMNAKPSSVPSAKPDAPAAPSNFKPGQAKPVFNPNAGSTKVPTANPSLPSRVPVTSPAAMGKPVQRDQAPSAPAFRPIGQAKPVTGGSSPSVGPAAPSVGSGGKGESKPIAMPRNTARPAASSSNGKPVFGPSAPAASKPSPAASRNAQVPSAKAPSAFRSQGPSAQPGSSRGGSSAKPAAGPRQAPSAPRASAPMSQQRPMSSGSSGQMGPMGPGSDSKKGR